MLRKALWVFIRPLIQLLSNLLNPDIGEEWLQEFKKFLRKEACWVKNKYLQLEKSFDIIQDDGTIQICNRFKQIANGTYKDIYDVNPKDAESCSKLVMFKLESGVDHNSQQMRDKLTKYQGAFSNAFWTHLVFEQDGMFFVACANLSSAGVLSWSVNSLASDYRWVVEYGGRRFLLPQLADPLSL